MLQAIPDVVTLKGMHPARKFVMLNSAKINVRAGSGERTGYIGKQAPPFLHNVNRRPYNTGASSKYRPAPLQLPSPLGSPVFPQQTPNGNGNVFSFQRSTPLQPQVCRSFLS